MIGKIKPVIAIKSCVALFTTYLTYGPVVKGVRCIGLVVGGDHMSRGRLYWFGKRGWDEKPGPLVFFRDVVLEWVATNAKLISVGTEEFEEFEASINVSKLKTSV